MLSSVPFMSNALKTHYLFWKKSIFRWTSNTLVPKIKDKTETPGELVKPHYQVLTLPLPELIRKGARCKPGNRPSPKTRSCWHTDPELLAPRSVRYKYLSPKPTSLWKWVTVYYSAILVNENEILPFAITWIVLC